MGSILSGRYRTRNRGAVERSLVIDIRWLRRRRLITPGAFTGSHLTWSRHGEPCAAAHVLLNMAGPGRGGVMTVDYTWDGSKHSNRVTIDAVPCRYGGHRLYFRCPMTDRRCEVVAFGGGWWASLRAQRLTYSTQSEDTLGRLYSARAKAESRALGKDGNPRPRGANRERLVERWIALEMAAEDMFASEAARRFGRLGLQFPGDL